MAFTTSNILSIKGALYNMTGATAYSGASSGTNIGKIVDVLNFQFGRDVKVYSRFDQGDTPFYARIVGESCRITVRIADYGAEWIKLISQKRPKSGYTKNYHFGAGASYVLGNILDSSYFMPVMIKDTDSPADYPALYLPSTVTESVNMVQMFISSRMQDVAEVSLLALHSDTFGSIGAFGDLAGFPAL